MEISGKVLREVEFRDRLRGYDTDEVDEFLEKVAVAVDELQAELARLQEEVGRRREEGGSSDEDSMKRMLVLAQRTADLAVSEARQEADRLLEEARAQSEALLSHAHEAVRRMRDDAEREIHARLGRLESEHERLQGSVRSLGALLSTERARLIDGLSSAMRFVEETLSLSEELGPVGEPGRGGERRGARPIGEELEPTSGDDSARGSGAGAPGPVPSGAVRRLDTRDVEAEIGEDAAAAVGGDAVPETDAQDEVPGAEDRRPGNRRSGDPTESRRADQARLERLQTTELTPQVEADEELWARWAAGGGLDGAGRQGKAPRIQDSQRPGGQVPPGLSSA